MLALHCNAVVTQDKAGLPWWLGLSVKGITVYDHNDRKTPRKVCESMRHHTRFFVLILRVVGSVLKSLLP